VAEFDGNRRGFMFGWGVRVRVKDLELTASGNVPSDGGSHEAEIEAALQAMRMACAVAEGSDLTLVGDSASAVDAINRLGGDVRGVSPKRLDRLRELKARFSSVRAKWQPREANKVCDRLAARAGLPTFGEVLAEAGLLV
jgi:ribonuclease HI